MTSENTEIEGSKRIKERKKKKERRRVTVNNRVYTLQRSGERKLPTGAGREREREREKKKQSFLPRQMEAACQKTGCQTDQAKKRKTSRK